MRLTCKCDRDARSCFHDTGGRIPVSESIGRSDETDSSNRDLDHLSTVACSQCRRSYLHDSLSTWLCRIFLFLGIYRADLRCVYHLVSADEEFRYQAAWTVNVHHKIGFSAVGAVLLVLIACAPRQNPTPSSENVQWTIQPGVVPLGWDLTYESLLKANGVGPETLFWEWAHLPSRGGIKSVIIGWKDEPVVSSILMELQGPQGDQHAYWFARTTDHAFYWEFKNGELDHFIKEPILVEKYDEAFRAMSSWQQAPSSGQRGITGDYYGFLNLYERGKSRQMLLIVDDLVKGESKGRLMQVFETLLSNIYSQQWPSASPS